MEKNNVIFVVIVILLISLSFIVFFDFNDHYKFFKKLGFGKQKEGFTWNNYNNGYCKSCGWKNRQSCSDCVNCGYCITANGAGSCVSGDQNGPYFRKDCAYYQYNNPYKNNYAWPSYLYPTYSYPSYPYPSYPYYNNYNNMQDAISDYMDENYNYKYPGSTHRNRPGYRYRN